MTIKTSGDLSISDIVAEFGGSSPHSLSEYYAGGSIVHTGAVGYPGGVKTNIPSSGQISLSNFYGADKLVPGNSGILTSGSSYTLPVTCGAYINVLVIAGGGGGGGGTSRDAGHDGYDYGGGGGASGGNAYVLSVPVTPGQTISYSIGSAGSAGGARDGVYSSGASGGTGGTTSVTVNASVVAQASGGAGGVVAPDGSASTAGGATTGTLALAVTNGSASSYLSGGAGAKGFTIATTVGLSSISSIIGYGSAGATRGFNATTPAESGTIYGAGGGGGGVNQANNNAGYTPAAGTVGAVFIWWGY